MSKISTLICAFVCLAAGPAVADLNAVPEGTITLASASGLYVRLAAPSEGGVPWSNVCGAAVNTEGVARATTAVVVDGRVFLSSGPRLNVPETEVAAATVAQASETPTPAPEPVAAKPAPEGLGMALARLFGLARS
jgi:hypothetical protein